MIENKNNEIEKEEKRLRNCQVSVYGLAGGMQILKRFLILAVGVYLIYRNIIKVGGTFGSSPVGRSTGCTGRNTCLSVKCKK